MKVYNEKHVSLTSNLNLALQQVRKLRNFNLEHYINAKVTLLNQYIKKSGLDTCVVAISGGIDSAVTLALVDYASRQKLSHIKKIIAVTIPSFDGSVTNQTDTIKKAHELCEKLGHKLYTLDITSSCEELAQKVENQLGEQNIDKWARGQLVSYVRTPSLYYFTSVLSSQGFKPVLVGTINRDEGAYLGYLCKSGDACVDLQLIADAHKNEIYKVANFFNLPTSILQATPTGDMYDGRVDEEVFGAPYDFVELFLSYKSMSSNTWKSLTINWNEEDHKQFTAYEYALEKLHRYNSHKYLAGSNAIHLDVLASAVDGGWIEGIHSTIHKLKQKNKIIRTDKFVGFVDNCPTLDIKKVDYSSEKFADVTIASNIFSHQEKNNVIDWVQANTSQLVRTNQYGYIKGEKMIGSSRLSFYNEDWAQIIFERIMLSGAINPIFNESLSEQYRAIGINPLFRVLKYSETDLLYPHYDDSFYDCETRKSLKTVLLVIQCAEKGGATRFIKDEQVNISFDKRDFSDKKYLPQDNEILYSFNQELSTLIFNHRVLHDGQKIEQGEKIIIRTDIMYEKTNFE